jgi:outer membrane protein TolC
MKNKIISIFGIFLLSLINASAQKPLSLDFCKEAALKNYPVIKQRALIEESKNYQISNASKAYLPQFGINAQASYQSDVTRLPLDNLPFKVQSLDKDQYKITADFNQVIFDGGNTSLQKDIHKAQAAIDQEKIELELYKVKERVTQLYFSILILNENQKQLDITKSDLENNLKRIQVQKDNGLSFQSNIDQIKSEILKIKQRNAEIKASQRAYLQMLSLFMGTELNETSKFEQPVKPVNTNQINRPELKIFEKQSELVLTQNRMSLTKSLPKANLFGQGGYGRPGLNMLKNEFEWFYIAGVRINWTFSNLYTFGKERKINQINRDIINNQSEIFLLNTNINLKQQENEIKKLEELIQTDNELLTLRTNIKKTSEIRLQNGIIGASDYINDLNQEEISRQNKFVHETQLLMALYQYQLISGN